jgi:hypothetical protein
MNTDKHVMMTKNYQEVFYSKYDILGHYEIKWFDSDWPLFEKHLQSIKLDYYTPKQKYIVEHVDTDYYHPDFNYGFCLSNLISAFKTVDIPLHALLLFTNHFGIEREINALAPDPHDRPIVVTSFITTTHYINRYQPVDVNPELIKYPAICMMGASRTHRNVVFRFLERHNLLETVAISVKNT